MSCCRLCYLLFLLARPRGPGEHINPYVRTSKIKLCKFTIGVLTVN